MKKEPKKKTGNQSDNRIGYNQIIKPQSISCGSLHCMPFDLEKLQILLIMNQKEKLHKLGQPVYTINFNISIKHNNTPAEVANTEMQIADRVNTA